MLAWPGGKPAAVRVLQFMRIVTRHCGAHSAEGSQVQMQYTGFDLAENVPFLRENAEVILDCFLAVYAMQTVNDTQTGHSSQ